MLTFPTSTEHSMQQQLSARGLRAWRNAIFTIFALSGLSLATWVSRLPAVRDELGIDTLQLGVLIFCMSAGSVIGLIAAPVVINRIGAKAGMVGALIVVSIGLVLIGVGSDLAASSPVVGLGLALFGFGNGTCDVIMNVEAAAVEKQAGRTLMPLMHAFFSFGTVAGAGLGALASGLAVPILVHTTVIAVAIAVTVLAVIRFVPSGAEADDAASAAASPRVPFRQRLVDALAVWKDVRLLLIGVIMLGMAFAEGSANDWLTIAVVDGHHQDNTVGAIVFWVFTASMTAGRIAGGPVLDRFGRVPVLRVSALLGVIGILLFIVSPLPWLAFVGTVFWALGCSLGFPVGMSAAADVDDPRLSAARVSAVAIIGYCAFLVGPPVIGLLAHQFGILGALLLILVLVVLAGLASPAARENHPSPVPAR
ncbi:MFS transporter [Cnuibacter physcomitrellae]|uniref:MFS transporter n=1 Tax=Cnuibacter physcomitrellae TaxID=1619308 RepID=UPI002175EAA4|nr:MFS transporter [Cnuibacter physcomitrellae]MCS5497484.1 MFS transporter [Cnuibacter physcomitrellae]